MLDDLKFIHQRDASDALGVVEKQADQLLHTYDVQFNPKKPILNIVVAGMGGSGWPASYINSWPSLNVPFEVVSGYELPKYVGENTLVISSSFSGNTEETVACFQSAREKNAQIIVMSSGGKLSELAKEHGYSLYEIPKGAQPRMSTFYFWAAYVQVFEHIGLVSKGSLDELHQASAWLKTQTSGWLPTVPSAKNPTKQLAKEMIGKSVVVYAGPLLAPVAHKWKICINENAKQVAWWNQFPEFSHNEFIGWSNQPIDKPYCVVDIRSNLDAPRINKRFEVTERMLSGLRPTPEVVQVQGETPLEQLLWSSIYGDFTAIYLALLNNVDPTPVDLVERFKTELDI